MDDDRRWHLAWAKLEAFKKNLPSNIEEKHVSEFHEVLDLLASASGEDVAPFRIPDSEVKPRAMRMMSSDFGSHSGPNVRYTHERYCARELMVRQIDEVIGYFQRILPPDQKRKYGFD